MLTSGLYSCNSSAILKFPYLDFVTRTFAFACKGCFIRLKGDSLVHGSYDEHNCEDGGVMVF